MWRSLRRDRRLGILGGTFDPVHVGHLIIAERAAEVLKLDRVLFVPTASNPLKDRAPVASGRDRLAMIRAAIRGNSRFTVSDVDLKRGGPSYAIDTVTELKRRTSAGLFLILGADALADLPRWRRAEELARHVTFAVVRRPGSRRPAAPRFIRRRVEVPAPLLEISATEIRERVRRGRSIRYLVPDAVAAMIRRLGLYR